MPRATFVNLVAVAMLWAVIALLHSAEFASCYPLFFVPTALFALALYRRAYKVETATVWGGWGAGFSAGFVVVFAELVVTTLVIILAAGAFGVERWCDDSGECTDVAPPPRAPWFVPPSAPTLLSPPAPPTDYEYWPEDAPRKMRMLTVVPWLVAMAVCQYGVMASFEELMKFHLLRTQRRARPDLNSDTATHVLAALATAVGFATTQGIMFTAFMTGNSDEREEEEELNVSVPEILTVAAVVFAAGVPLHMLSAYYQGVVIAAKAAESEMIRTKDAVLMPILVRGTFLFSFPLLFELLGGRTALVLFCLTGVASCTVMFAFARRAEQALPSDYLRRVGNIYAHLGYAALEEGDDSAGAVDGQGQGGALAGDMVHANAAFQAQADDVESGGSGATTQRGW